MKHLKLISIIIILFYSSIGQGQIWTPISQPGIDINIVTEDVGYSYINEPEGSHGSKYTLKKTVDGCQTFSTIYTGSGDMGCCYLDEMFFLNADTGFIVIGDGGEVELHRTLDGGQNWISFDYGGPSGLSIFFLDEEFGYYCYYPEGSGTSYLTQNGTTVYTTQQYIFSDINYSYPYTTTEMKFINDSTGFIICEDILDNGVILKTSNFGYDWTEVNLISNNLFKDILFVSDSVGIAIGTNGIIYKTSDYGEQWQLINYNSTSTLNSIDFFSDSTLYIVGENGLVLKSLDIGNTWSQENFINENDLIYVRAFNNNRIYVNDISGNLYSNQDDLSVFDNIQSDIKIYPNPAQDIINISIPPEIKSYHINMYNLQGKKIQSTSNKVLDLKDIAKGVYIIEVETEFGILKRKTLKL